MTISDEKLRSKLEQNIERYDKALSLLEAAEPHPSFEQIVEVLVARDAVEEAQEGEEEVKGETLAELVRLDNRLQKQSQTIAQNGKLNQCRRSLQPPESAWWWYLKPPAVPQKIPEEPKWASYDWAWNFLTVVFLVFTGTFATQTAQAFSNQGFDWLGTFSTISQGAGVILVAGGTLTDKGKRVFDNVLNSLNIPPFLHAEVTCACSALLLLTTYSLNNNLDKVGNFYYEQGQTYEENHEWSVAKDLYQRALDFLPDADATEVYFRLGRVNEQLGQIKEARINYEEGFIREDPEAMIYLARLILLQESHKVGWEARVTRSQAAKLRQVETYLDLAKRKLQYDDGDRLSREHGASSNLLSPQLILKQRLLIEIFITQGMLKWSELSWEAAKTEAEMELLEQAEEDFAKAAKLEYDLPTIPAGRRANCYKKIAAYINIRVPTPKYRKSQNLVEATKEEAESCYSIITRLNTYDVYEASLMLAAIDVKIKSVKSSGSSRQK